jgi:DNA-directed RNA polymerase I subunit RPA43
VTAAAQQHLEPLLNRYVPSFGGVLLAYRNVVIGDHAARKGEGIAADDDSECLAAVVDEYATGFVYVTAEVDLFVPRRGAWMEGVINLQNEGHVGLVCWGRFNASIEASRLPAGYRWIEFGSRESQQYEAARDPFDSDNDEDDNSNNNSDYDHDSVKNQTRLGNGGGVAAAGDGEQDDADVQQMHTTGFWVDANRRKLRGKLRFRIRAYDVGVSGEHAFLSIEGTMLDDAGERALAAAAAERARSLKERRGITRAALRQVAEFSVTRFAREVEDETAPVPVPSRPVSRLASRAGSEQP